MDRKISLDKKISLGRGESGSDRFGSGKNLGKSEGSQGRDIEESADENFNDVEEFNSYDGWGGDGDGDLEKDFVDYAEMTLRLCLKKRGENVVPMFFLGKLFQIRKNEKEAYKYFHGVYNLMILGKNRSNVVYSYFGEKAKVYIQEIIDQMQGEDTEKDNFDLDL